MKSFWRGGIVSAFLCTSYISGLSFVYNARVALSTRQELPRALPLPFDDICAFTMISHQRTTVSNITQSARGCLCNYMRLAPPWTFEIDAAFGRIRTRAPNRCHEHTELDDILGTISYTYRTQSGQAAITVSGLIGLPTHPDYGLDGGQIGTGHFGIGGQLDAGLRYDRCERCLLMLLGRCIHFSPRTARITCDEARTPFEVRPGILFDLIIGHRIKLWDRQSIECGYNASWLTHASITPALAFISSLDGYLRNTVYATYTYGFTVHESNPGALIIGASYGWDARRSNALNLKKILGAWVTCGFAF